MKIPVFHDDQHGTAIISAAAFLNALEIVGKKIENVKVVFCGAGAAAHRLREPLLSRTASGSRTSSWSTGRASSTRAARRT